MSRMSLNITRSTHLLTTFLTAVLLVGASFSATADELADQGAALFKVNCAACHKPIGDMTGPGLQGAKARWEGKGDIYAWVKNSQAYLKTGNPYAKALFA